MSEANIPDEIEKRHTALRGANVTTYYQKAYKELAMQFNSLAAERDSLRVEVDRLRKEREWQPIETAPKDGTIIQGWYSGGWMPRMRWSVYYKAWEVRNGWEWMQLFTQTPTHWMSLPGAPKQEEQP